MYYASAPGQRCFLLQCVYQRHTFRQPARPLEPPTPRASVLGLDRLAQEKREAAAANGEGSRKKPRLDGEGSESQFKSMSYKPHSTITLY